jgi:hypothetical protein
VEDDIVALDLPTETYLGLNQSAASLWQALAGGASEDELVQLLIDRYAIGADAQRDVGEFIAALQARDMLESVPE